MTELNMNANHVEMKKHAKVNRGPFGTLEEAQQHKPAQDNARLFRVAGPHGQVAWVWARHREQAVALGAQAAGWAAAEHGKAPTKEKVAEALAQLSPEDRAVLIAQFVPPTEKAPGKGKK